MFHDIKSPMPLAGLSRLMNRFGDVYTHQVPHGTTHCLSDGLTSAYDLDLFGFETDSGFHDVN